MRVFELACGNGDRGTGQRKGGKPRLPHPSIWSVLHGAAPSKSSAKSLQMRRQRHLKVDPICKIIKFYNKITLSARKRYKNLESIKNLFYYFIIVFIGVVSLYIINLKVNFKLFF